MKFITKAVVLSLLAITAAHAESTAEATVVRASWYGKWHHGKLMANGKPFNMFDPSIVAHRTLPLGTRLLVRNASNGKARVVTVQDRGPYIHGRSLDASYALAAFLGFADAGLATLEVKVL